MKNLNEKYSSLSIDFVQSEADLKLGESYAIFHISKNDWTEHNIYFGQQHRMHAFINLDTKGATLLFEDGLKARIAHKAIAFTAPNVPGKNP